MRTDFSLSTAERWSSTGANAEAPPSRWFHENVDGSICLKDTGGGMYANELESALRFVFRLPKHPRHAEQGVVRRLTDGVEREVRLFCVRFARNHYLGEWVVVSSAVDSASPHVVLARLAAQSALLQEAYSLGCGGTRSRSEAAHLVELRDVLPGWHIVHEPEAVSNLPTPLVVDGSMAAWAGSSYTVDYVATDATCRRVCFESKNDPRDATEEARCKARRLRDGSSTRVVVCAGHGDGLCFLDFGTPLAPREEWCDAAALRQSLGV